LHRSCAAVAPQVRQVSHPAYDARVEVRVLGPLEVADELGHLVGLRAKERALLCRLAAGRSTTVSIDALINALWHDDPPASAHKTLQGLVHHLRRVLGSDAIAREPHGYRLVGVDVDRWMPPRSVGHAVAATVARRQPQRGRGGR
jgi:two-component SAPR family response regulator